MDDYTGVQTPPERSARHCTAWFGALDQVDFEIDFYDRVLARNPDDVTVLRALGELLARKGVWNRSLEVEQRLIELRPRDGIAHYNFACSLAMQGQSTQAVDALERAIDYGYRDFGHMEVDPDLESLRHLPAFSALMKRHGWRK